MTLNTVDRQVCYTLWRDIRLHGDREKNLDQPILTTLITLTAPQIMYRLIPFQNIQITLRKLWVSVLICNKCTLFIQMYRWWSYSDDIYSYSITVVHFPTQESFNKRKFFVIQREVCHKGCLCYLLAVMLQLIIFYNYSHSRF